jgi:hypothetical protein
MIDYLENENNINRVSQIKNNRKVKKMLYHI